MYPASPVVNALMPVVDVVVGSGNEMSVAVIVAIEKTAYSVEEYAKQAVFSSMNDIVRAECDSGISCIEMKDLTY